LPSIDSIIADSSPQMYAPRLAQMDARQRTRRIAFERGELCPQNGPAGRVFVAKYR